MSAGGEGRRGEEGGRGGKGRRGGKGGGERRGGGRELGGGAVSWGNCECKGCHLIMLISLLPVLVTPSLPPSPPLSLTPASI